MRRIAFNLAAAACLLVVISATTLAQQNKVPKRNVLLIATDDCNCDLGCLGNSFVKTPNIDKLAARGVLFSNAHAQYPVCNPSRSSFMTGLYPEQTGVMGNGGDLRIKNPNVVTMAQMFRNQGYTAARVGKIYHYGVPNQIGTDGEDDLASWDIRVNPRGIDREVHEKIHSIRPNAPIESRFGGTLSWLNLDSESAEHTDAKGADAAIQLMNDLHPDKTSRPFFLAMGFFRPHTPYVAPSKFFDWYPQQHIYPVLEKPDDRDDIPLAALHDRPGQRELSVAVRREIIQAYYASISLMDEQLGRVVDALDELGLADNTVIVFLSDHGYHLGAHGLWQKSDLFEGSCHVPLIIAEPGSPGAGQVSDAPAGLIDIYPTLAEVCDVVPPDHLRGKSLRPLLNDPTTQVNEGTLSVTVSRARQMHREFVKGTVLGHSIRTKRYRYTQWGDGQHGHELYDYETDPDEYTNLADEPEHATTVKRLQTLLAEVRANAI